LRSRSNYGIRIVSSVRCRDLGYDVVEAFQVLDIDREITAIPRRAALRRLPTFSFLLPGIGVRELVDQDHLRMPCQHADTSSSGKLPPRYSM